MSSSDSEDENIIKYGTPLEPYEEDELPTKRKYQEPADQFAVDANGRRRFHGAFTGGFSAGFGNTVGSMEGWTPSTFKSSRSEKAHISNQRPEDFMDEEDRSEFGIAPRQLQTHKEYSGQKRARQQTYYDGPIPGEPVLGQIVRAVHETAAVKMLRAMGWREGQGMGERLSSKQKKDAKQQHKVYGCYIPQDMRQDKQDEDHDSSSSEYDFDTLFAPDDYEPYILHRKNDRFGLGYKALSRHSILGNLVGEYGTQAGTSKSHLVMKDKGRKVSIRGQAFGVGAFEADDEDIYAKEDMSHYDFDIGPTPTRSDQKNTNKEKSKTVLEGFTKAVKNMSVVPTYPAPALPRDYVPAPAGTRRTRFGPSTHKERDQGLGRHELTAEARGELLGEKQIEPVQSTLSPPAPQAQKEDPITKLLGRNINFTSNEQKKELDFIPIADSGREVQKVFRPFAGNLEKQARYEKYLEDRGHPGESSSGTDRLSEWERERELLEFEQAAKLYRPLSGVMGDRFTHASEPDDGALNPLCAVAKSRSNHGQATKEQMEAAERGLYGVMTRVQSDWRPESLVCKRFNVQELGANRIEKSEEKPKVSYSIFSYLESSVHDRDSFAKEQSKFSGSKSLLNNTNIDHTKTAESKNSDGANTANFKNNYDNISHRKLSGHKKIDDATGTGFNKRMTVAELFLKESENNKEQGITVTETINQFDKMDLYKSIFLSDSEDEEVVEKKSKDVSDFIEVPKNVERNHSPPRGIFANIDFDEINSWKRKDVNKVSVENKNKTSEKIDHETSVPNEEVYGPKIPENIQNRLLAQNFSASESIEVRSSSEESWVDIKEIKHKKVKKKKNKKHKHKKKSKNKDKY